MEWVESIFVEGLKDCLVQSSVWRAPKDSGSQSIDFSSCSFIRLRVTWSDQDIMSWNCVYIM